MSAIKDLQHVITDLCDVPDLLKLRESSGTIDAAFALGTIVTRLEYIKEKLEQHGNGDL